MMLVEAVPMVVPEAPLPSPEIPPRPVRKRPVRTWRLIHCGDLVFRSSAD